MAEWLVSRVNILRIDPTSSHPPFQQLREQFIDQIMGRQLPAGTKIPTVRRLAADLGLAPNTVARTYRELVAEGYLISKGRNGTFVADIAPVTEVATQQAEEATRRYVMEMRRLGFGDQTIVQALHRAL